MLRIPKHLFTEAVRHAAEGYPHEVCGLLLGKTNGAGHEVVAIFPAKNINTDRARDRYELDPQDFLAADGTARRQGLEIIGVYHSHPDHPSQASETDSARAWEGYSYLIIATTKKELNTYQSWRLHAGSLMEEKVEVTYG